MRNAGLDEAQVGIKIAGRNINSLRYADDTAFMSESEEELKSLLMKVKEESEEAGLKISNQKLRSWHPISLVQLLSRVQLFATPWTAAHQASLCITNSRSSLKLTSIESVMPSSHLILCRPLFLLPSIPPSISLFQ